MRRDEMAGERKNIRVFSPDFVFLREADDYEQLLFRRVFTGAGDFEIRIGANKKNAECLTRGNIVLLDEERAGIIDYWEKAQDRKGERLVVKGFTPERILNRRVTFPEAGKDVWEMTGPAESVVKAMVERNLGAGAESARKMEEVGIDSDARRGGMVTWRTAYKPLDEEVKSICMDVGMGVSMRMEPRGVKAKRFVLETVFGTDRTAGQNVVPPVIFSAGFDNILEQKLVDSTLDWRNTAITGGKGEGAAREIVTVYEGAAMSGLARREIFADIRDSAVTSETLPDKGREALKLDPKVMTLDGKVNPFHGWVYGKDYFLGDIVTRVYGDAALDARITEVTESWDAKGYHLECVFGNRMPTIWDKIRGGVK